jgi:succinyl-diaminopimelate desuccinylase
MSPQGHQRAETPGATARTETVASIVDLARCLVRIPSQAGIDSSGSALSLIYDWLITHAVTTRYLNDPNGEPVAVLGEVAMPTAGPTYCLNACIDTAPFGDLSTWAVPPASAEIVDGWLYGRGSADSKTTVAIFAHIAAELTADRTTQGLGGRLLVVFDGDEHTGRFRGVKRLVTDEPNLAGVMIGYPGNHGIVAGARGFYRVLLTTYGTARHSGSVKKSRENAILKASALATMLGELELPTSTDPTFPFGPTLTVTAIEGGGGYSSVPDRCLVRVDVRLTPTFDSALARDLIKRTAKEVDRTFHTRAATTIAEEDTWPAYQLPTDSVLVKALKEAARKQLRRPTPAVVCGPSNAGNFFAANGIEATCGFGVTYENLHAPNERIDLSTIEMVHDVYLAAVKRLLLH